MRGTQDGYNGHKIVRKGLALSISLLVFMSVLACLTVDTAEGHKVHVHEELTMKSIQTLYEDGNDYIPQWLNDLDVTGDLRAGSRDADMMDMSRNHYYNPHTGDGLSEFEDAKSNFVRKVYDAQDSISSGDIEQGVFELGWALHVLQDMTVPHHVHSEPGDGHSDYEDWISQNMDVGHVIGGGNYTDIDDIDDKSPGDWVHNTALISYDYYDYVADSGNASDENYTYAWENLQPVAIRQGAGFLHWFFNRFIPDDVFITVTGRAENSLDIRWTQDYVENFSHYELYIYENKTGLDNIMEERDYYTKIETRYMNEYTFSGLDHMTKYYIRIRVVRDNQDDTISSTVETRTIPSTTFIALILLVVAISIFVLIQYNNNWKGKKYNKRGVRRI